MSNNDKVVLEADDQFEISCRDHFENMVKMLRETTKRLMIPIKFDEFQFELFVKEYSSDVDRMERKYDNFLRKMDKEKNKYG